MRIVINVTNLDENIARNVTKSVGKSVLARNATNTAYFLVSNVTKKPAVFVINVTTADGRTAG